MCHLQHNAQANAWLHVRLFVHKHKKSTYLLTFALDNAIMKFQTKNYKISRCKRGALRTLPSVASGTKL